MIPGRNRAFSLTEALIAAAIMVLVVSISAQIAFSMNKDYKVIMTYLNSYLKSREILDIISKDCRMAVRMLDAYSGYTTSNSCLVLKVPSVDGSNNIIDVNSQFDHIIYQIVGNDLWKTVMPGALSARQPSSGVLKSSIDSMNAAYNSTPLSSVPHKSAITHISLWFSISESILGKTYTVTPGTTIKLMNYEWEQVR